MESISNYSLSDLESAASYYSSLSELVNFDEEEKISN